MGNKLVTDFDTNFRLALVQRFLVSESSCLKPLLESKSKLSDINELIYEYLKFMKLMQRYPSVRFSPSEMVDQVWHEHILFTKEYRKFCKKHFGSYVNHNPTVPGYSTATASDDQRSYVNSLYFYELHFKSTPSTKYWPSDKITVWLN